MSDLQKYIKQRSGHDAEFAEDFAEGYAIFKLGILLRQAREKAGLTQEEIARQIGTPTSTVSKIENHTEDVRPPSSGDMQRRWAKTSRLVWRNQETPEPVDRRAVELVAVYGIRVGDTAVPIDIA